MKGDLVVKKVNFSSKEIVEHICNGEVVAFPTETVFGLGIIYDNEEAFEKLVEVKQRRPDKPFTLMLSDKSEINNYAITDSKIIRIIEKFMPGEITLLLRPKNNLYSWVTLNSKYIGIRVSGKKEVCDLIRNVGKPMLVTSANISSYPACCTFEETYQVFKDSIGYIVEGKTSSNKPSTIIVCDDTITLIREGSISFEEIKKIWEE